MNLCVHTCMCPRMVVVSLSVYVYASMYACQHKHMHNIHDGCS
jgi:hypothetical protein